MLSAARLPDSYVTRAHVRSFETPISKRRIVVRIGCHIGTVLGAVIGRTLVRGAGGVEAPGVAS